MSDTVASALGRRLLEARRQRRLTQRDLGDLVGIAPEVIGRIERGAATPRADTLAVLATALHASTDALLGLAEPKRPVAAEPESPELRRLVRRLRFLRPDGLVALERALSAVGRDAVTAARATPASTPSTRNRRTNRPPP